MIDRIHPFVVRANKALIFCCVLFFMAFAIGPCSAEAQGRPYIDWPAINTSSSEYPRFQAFVDQALAGNPGYAFSAVDAMVMYRASGQDRYANHAVTMVESWVAAEELKINAGQRADIAADSYLYVGDHIRDLAVTYDWAFDKLTASQKTRWAAYAEQAVWNVWHSSEAKWGGVSYPWSGWSTSNPGNNYYYSFIEATMLWALASQNQTWLDFLRNVKLPPLVAYFQNLPGGGSREGTGYGTSHKRLFWLYLLWKESTGEDLAADSSHCRDSIDYWVHATVPTLNRFAPLGDQARDSSASLYDYQRALVLAAVNLNAGTAQAQHGMWWLQNITLTRMSSGFNLRDALLNINDPAVLPQTIIYHAAGTGHLFARSSWETNATWISFVAGPYVESHAAQDQGAFSIYKDQWLAVTENIFSHSGIHQEPGVANIVRFVRGSTTIGQTYGSTSNMSWNDTQGTLTINGDLSPAYSGSSDVQEWRRNLQFTGDKLIVRDTFRTTNGTQAIWQINTPAQPVINGSVIHAGDLTITPQIPQNPEIAIVNWNSVDAQEYANGGWKVELSGGTEYTVELHIESAQPRDNTAPAAPRGLRKVE